MNDVPVQFRVELNKFTEHDLNGSFVALPSGYGVIRVYPLEDNLFAVEISSTGQNLSESFLRFLTQTEVNSLHFGVRASDGIKELRVELD